MSNTNTFTYNILVNGQVVPTDLLIYSINIEKYVNRIPIAKIVVQDGDASSSNFENSSSALFTPGNIVSIEAGYDNFTHQLFTGIVTGQSLKFFNSSAPMLEVECRHQAVKMAVGRKCATYENKKDSDIIADLIKAHGIAAKVAATNTKWQKQVQYYATDWDFSLARAEANGMIVIALDGAIQVSAPDVNTKSIATLTYGQDILSFDANLNAIFQLNKVTATSWSPTTQKVVTGIKENSLVGAGNLSSKKLSAVLGIDNYQMQTSALLNNADLENWSSAQLTKSAYSKIQGEAKVMGNPAIVPGGYITLEGLGERFNGDHIVSGVVHEIIDGTWTTEVSLGLLFEWFTAQPDVMAPSASGLLPGVRGLLNAKVKKIDEDPDGQFRILLDIPLLDQSGSGVWARLANFYASNGAGAFFMPEIGDEVIIGFLNEDPRFPVVLGSLYSNPINKPNAAFTPAKDNPKKGIVSKSGISLEFDDAQTSITITTPTGKKITMDDFAQSLSLQDQYDNAINMTSTGIEIKSNGNITLTAGKTISITGNELSAEVKNETILQGGEKLELKAKMIHIN